MRLLFYSCPLLVLLVAAGSDAQLLAPLMSLAGGLASNLNPFQGIASSLTGGVGSGGGSGLRGGLLSSLRGAASTGIGFSALPGRNMPLVPAPVAPPPHPLPPFAGFGSSSNIQYGQQMPMLTPEELAEIMQSQSQASPSEFDSFGNPSPHPNNKPQPNHPRGPNNQPPQPQYQQSNPPAYSQPQPQSNFRPAQNSYQGNRDNDYNSHDSNLNNNDDDGNEDDHRPNDDSEPDDYNAVRPHVRRPQYPNQPTNYQNNNSRIRAQPSYNGNYDGPAGDRDQDRDYNQFEGPPVRGNSNYNSNNNNNNNNNYRGSRNENAPVIRGYRARSPSHDDREVASHPRPYSRPQEKRPEQGNRYLQGGFTPVSAAGGFDGPPDRPAPHNTNTNNNNYNNNPGVRQNTRPQSGRSSQYHYNSMHDQKPRDDRDYAEDSNEDDRDGRMESYGRSPSEPHAQASYGYYNKDENVGDESDDYDRRRRRRTNNSRY